MKNIKNPKISVTFVSCNFFYKFSTCIEKNKNFKNWTYLDVCQKKKTSAITPTDFQNLEDPLLP